MLVIDGGQWYSTLISDIGFTEVVHMQRIGDRDILRIGLIYAWT